MLTNLKTFKNRNADRYPKLTGLLVTVAGRLASRRQRGLRVYFDGEDWVHTWRGGVYVGETASLFPHRATNDNLSLFMLDFTPAEGHTVVDVGAGVGTEVQAFSALVGETGLVVCIEADPRAFRCLSKTVTLADLRNVRLVNSAVTDREGEIFLSQEASSISNSVIANNDRGVAVSATTLDKVLDDVEVVTVDYLKMNIEGAEVLALEGFTTGPGRVRNWCISCHDFKPDPESATLDRVNQWLVRNGHAVKQHRRNDARPWESFYLYAKGR